MIKRGIRSQPCGHMAVAGLLVTVMSWGLGSSAGGDDAAGERAFGTRGIVGCGEAPKRLERLEITKPGVYENLLIDGEWTATTPVKITADDVTLRNCEIRNSTKNA